MVETKNDSPNVSYVAAFRTYTWNSTVVELAARFFASCPGARHVVLADETRGCLGISEYEVISHTEDTTELGLLVYPKGSSLWYNVDYGAYILLSALPGYEYYLLSESDLAVNVDLRPMIYAAKSEEIDAIIMAYNHRRLTGSGIKMVRQFSNLVGDRCYFLCFFRAAPSKRSLLRGETLDSSSWLAGLTLGHSANRSFHQS